MKFDIGTMNIRTYRNHDYMLKRYAYTTKTEGLQALKEAKGFSDKYRRNEISVLMKDRIQSGEGQGKTVYVVGTRGTGR